MIRKILYKYYSRFIKKKLLIVKLDAIGDYIIFRNYIYELKKSKKYRRFDIYLLTSLKNHQVSSDLDNNFCKSILLNKYTDDFSVDVRNDFINQLNDLYFNTIIVPVFSPDILTHQVVEKIKSNYKIGFNGDTTNQTIHEKFYFEKNYTKLIDNENKFSHEIERLNSFFESLLDKKIQLRKPDLSIISKSNMQRIVICPAAGSTLRMWSTNNYAQLICLLHENYEGFEFIVAISDEEYPLFEEINRCAKVNLKHFIISSIKDLINIFSSSNLVLCNDSSAAHIAVGVGVKSICISNGNHYGRFIPYPSYLDTKQVFVLPELLKNMSEYQIEKLYFKSDIDINDISIEDVYKSCCLVLDDNK